MVEPDNEKEQYLYTHWVLYSLQILKLHKTTVCSVQEVDDGSSSPDNSSFIHLILAVNFMLNTWLNQFVSCVISAVIYQVLVD